jgi:DNA mismatch repair protein MutL
MSARFARIHLLPQALIGQIAAGEVIERPASVVKELIENSLDAGARQIDIDIQEGGIGLIRIKDDGWGIEPADLKLALTPHATSKIGSLLDLEQVSTLGFRGEALPSIGSISRLLLASRARGSSMGWLIRTEGREAIGEPEPTPHPEGTTVEIRELFFNTPARRKFLRTEQTESLQVQHVVRRIALSRFEVGFRFIQNRRPLLNLKPGCEAAGRLRRVREVCGASLVENRLDLDASTGTLRLWGWLGLPAIARPQTELQYVYVNGRPVRDKLINHALRMAYQDLIETGQQPAFVLYLELDPEAVDVNVHPAKSEVRFRDSRRIHDFVYSAVQRALAQALPLSPCPEEWRGVAALAPAIRESAERFYRTMPAAVREPLPINARSFGRPLGVLKSGYVVVENEGGVVVIDLKAALKQFVFERLRSAWQGGSVPSLPLLIPATLGLKEPEVELLMRHSGVLGELGLVIECAGPGTIVIRQIPALLRGADWRDLIHGVVNVLSTSPRARLPAEQAEAVLRTMAGQGSIEREGFASSWDDEDLCSVLRDLESWIFTGEPCRPGLWRQLSAAQLARLIEGKE